MNFYVITDTHFGHDKMPEFCGRPVGFESKILNAVAEVVREDDVLIHLGDICWGEDSMWMEVLRARCLGKLWLVRGNHDKKSNSWYLKNGFDFVGDTVTMRMFGKKILFSHKPRRDDGYDVNIHGHFHNNTHRSHEPELVAIKNEKQKLVMMEHHYRPVNLKGLCGH